MFNYTLYCNQTTPTTVIITGDRNTVKSPEILYSYKAPVNWNKMSYTFTRNATYIGLIAKFTATLGWTKEVKVWLDNIFQNIGINAVVTIKITAFDGSKHAFVYFINGVLNQSTISITQYTTSCNIEESPYYQNFTNRNAIAINVQNTKSLVVNAANPAGITITKIPVYDIYVNGSVAKKAFRAFDIFNSLLAIMTGVENTFQSPIFNVGGEYEYLMITTGQFLRGFDENHASLSISFQTLFKSLNILCLALSIKYDDNGNPFIVVDKLQKTFKRTLTHTFTNPKNLTITPDTELMVNLITTGYKKFQNNQNNTLAGHEYNLQSTYTTPINPITSNLSLTSDIRADGTAIQLLLDASITSQTTDTTQNQLDSDIFMIDCFKDSDTLIKSRATELFSVCIDDVTGEAPAIPINLRLTPARIFTNWEQMIHAGCRLFDDQYIRFNQAALISKLRTKYNLPDAVEVVEQADRKISTLARPFLKGQRAKFNATLTIDDVLAIANDPEGLYAFYNPIDKITQYGWVKEISEQPIDKTTNVDLMIADDSITVAVLRPKLKRLDGGYILNLTGGYIFKIGQN
jgi:hypothetical protein